MLSVPAGASQIAALLVILAIQATAVLVGVHENSTFFEGKLALITGGSSGIGLELAKQLVQAGASVAILARSPEKLAAAEDTLTPLLRHPEQFIHLISADVTDVEALRSAIEALVSTYGVPDFLFNCAGVALPGYVEELELEVFKWTMDIDFHGTVNTTKLLLPYFLKRGSGHIIKLLIPWQAYSVSLATVPTLELNSR